MWDDVGIVPYSDIKIYCLKLMFLAGLSIYRIKRLLKGKIIMPNVREYVLKVLLEAENNEVYSNLLLNHKLNNIELNDFDKKLFTQIVYGVVSYKLTIDYIISKLSKIKLSKLSKPILNILRIGIYQIYYLDKIPVSAACNESVKLAKKYGHVSSAGYVNAMLRNASRTEFDSFFDNIESDVERLSKKYSHPDWMVNLWIKKFGVEGTEKLLIANNSKTYDSIRVNTLKISRDELVNKLQKEEFDVKGGLVEDIIYTNDIKRLIKSNYFSEGYFTVQDEAPAMVAHLLNPQKTDKVLDMCAAPGGKTTHIAELMGDSGQIVAFELYEHRVKLINGLTKRLGIKIIETCQNDATIFDENFVNSFDKVLADVPCSGLGVIRKKPDIKWNTKEEDIEELTKIQYKILENAAKYVKQNGIIVYSTCTNIDKENVDLIHKFIAENKEFSIEKVVNIPEEFKTGLTIDGMLELSPHRENCDGFFICILKKNNI